MREALLAAGFDADAMPAESLRELRFVAALREFLPFLHDVPGTASNITACCEKLRAGLEGLQTDVQTAFAVLRDALYTQEGNLRDALLPDKIGKKLLPAAATRYQIGRASCRERV